jgi:hypothetical protein
MLYLMPFFGRWSLRGKPASVRDRTLYAKSCRVPLTPKTELDFPLNARLTRVITSLRLPIRKTRPSMKTVITLGLRKIAPDRNRCWEGDAYLAHIRQSRCHRAGISFV